MEYTVNYKVKSTGVWSEAPGGNSPEQAKENAALFTKQDNIAAVYISNDENKVKDFLKGSSADLPGRRRKFFSGFNIKLLKK